MATFADLLTNTQVNAIKSVKTVKSEAEKHTTNISVKVWETLYDLAVELGQHLDKTFWKELDREVKQNRYVFVIMKGAHHREILPVRNNLIFAKHVGELLKRYNFVIRVDKNTATHINWDNWAAIYRQLTYVGKRPEYDYEMSRKERELNRETRRLVNDFYEAAEVNRYHKHVKRISFEDARDRRKSEQKVDFETKVMSKAKRILVEI